MSSHDHASRAAEIAAKQVEAIVEAAQSAARDIERDAARKFEEERTRLEAEYASRRQALEEEVAKLRADAKVEADRERREAHEFAERERSEAAAAVKRLRDEARAQALERVSAAEAASDEALADARAISSGLRRLGETLEEHAERILRDVQAGHKRLRGDLRVASGGPMSPAEGVRRAASEEPRSGTRRSARGDNPFDGIDVPSWVERD